MRRPFAHDAVLLMEPDADIAAPGGAITVALCGRGDHEPPCPVAPHHTAARRAGDEIHLRVLFATEPEREVDVRHRITEALAARWPVRSSSVGTVATDEVAHAARLTST